MERSGVVDSITKVLVGLYELPEKPANAIDFIKEYLGAPVKEDTDRLKKLVDEQAKQLKEKDDQIQALQQQLAALQASFGQPQ